MADTKISALTGATAAAGANELAINEAGASKKLTVRQIEEFVHDKGADVASAATVTLGDGHYFHITGTTTITDIDFTTSWDGRYAILVFDASLTLTHNATTLILPGAANIITQAGDTAIIVVDAGDNVKVVSYVRAAELGSIGTNRVRALGNTHAISSTTATEVTGLGPMTLEAGTYTFNFSLIVQSATSTVSPKLGVNFTGTAAVRTFIWRFADLTSAITAQTFGMDDEGVNTFGYISGMASRTFTTTAPNFQTTVGTAVSAINTDIPCFIEGVLIVTASGDLELWHGSETATSTSVMAGSSLVVIRTA